MSGNTFDLAKQRQGYLMPMQRTSCNNCQHRMVHHMQCGRSGIYVQAFGVCNLHTPNDKPANQAVAQAAA